MPFRTRSSPAARENSTITVNQCSKRLEIFVVDVNRTRRLLGAIWAEPACQLLLQASLLFASLFHLLGSQSSHILYSVCRLSGSTRWVLEVSRSDDLDRYCHLRIEGNSIIPNVTVDYWCHQDSMQPIANQRFQYHREGTTPSRRARSYQIISGSNCGYRLTVSGIQNKRGPRDVGL